MPISGSYACYLWEKLTSSLVLIGASYVWDMENQSTISFYIAHQHWGLWYKLFSLAKMDWVLPRSISDMIISFKGLRSSIKGQTVWKLFASLCFGLCDKREILGFLKKSGEQKRCYGPNFSLWTFYIVVTFKHIPLNVIQLNWLLASNSNGVDNNERSWVQFWGDATFVYP